MRFTTVIARSKALGFVVAVLLSACTSIPKGRSSVDDVSVVGAHKVDDSDIEEKIATAPSPKFLMLFRGFIYDYEIFDRLTLQRDLARVERYYRARGFYEAHARAGRVLKKSDGHVHVEIVVEEGPPTVIGKVEIQGIQSLPQDERKRTLKRAGKLLPKGDRFEEGPFGDAETAIKKLLNDRGYAHATVTRDAVVDVVHHTADIMLTVETGPKAVFGDVTIDGLGNLPDAPVRRALDITKGKPYSASELDDAQQAALDLGVFSSVDVIPDLGDPKTASTVVPVHIKVERAKLHAWKLGGGAEFDPIKTDIHGIVGWQDHNFLGGMRQYTVSFRPGVVLYPLRVNDWVAPQRLLPEFKLKNEFRQPGFIEARTNAFIRPELNLFPVLLRTHVNSNDPVLGYLEFKGGVGVDRQLWKFYGSLSYNVQVESPFYYKGPADNDLKTLVIAYPELDTRFDFVNDRVKPRKGVSVSNTLQVAGGIFGGVARDVRLQPDVRGYIPLGKRVTLAARAAVGVLWANNYGDSVRDPTNGFQNDTAGRTNDLQIMFFRGLFAGGPNSDRGYPLRGIGPHEPVPFESIGGISTASCNANATTAADCLVPVGGFTSWEASLELRITIAGPVSMAVFTDSADVANAIAIHLSRPHLSSGLGLRYDTPVGPIRLDVGYRLPGLQFIGGRGSDTEPDPDKLVGLPIALAFGIGEAF
ncbi:MAG TPA: POTRA domain-containing protein [Polyangiaceae bacterium]|jgi:outer membrane protein insertion porin family/translocation and assembly module TamA|nr:POTRA domain-containing protein [Polyangiaceae bacterium]